MDYRGLKLEQWRPIIEEWRRSGCSMTAWCKEQEVPIHLLQYWRDKVNQKSAPSQFVTLEDQPGQTPLVIRCSEYCIEVPTPFDEEQLVRCLRLIRRAS